MKYATDWRKNIEMQQYKIRIKLVDVKKVW